ncbi:GNAT family N-acetyltransferase [Solibacillus sp. MA9]|uniref:GNAT family N-acetyltransferase n=1 Tax=Solibacillus palustris TaxID=2908203 RepID=A0ABS9UAY4_9BACL|nr:GNAT family N-acetyltransferase [Solibacillus sp. MA9]MCH7321492.1 GNAT family N-acetyltransferase [Solibacillus sp. MA9]
MQVKLFEARYANSVAILLNKYLPFEEENENTVLQAGGIQYICVANEEVVGYIAGHLIEEAHNEFPYFEQELRGLRSLSMDKATFNTSHLVVNPSYRGQGIGRALVEAYNAAVKEQADAMIVVGWVKSDTNRWEAEKLFTKIDLTRFIYLDKYFKPYEVYCPSCAGLCYCDADIYYKAY